MKKKTSRFNVVTLRFVLDKGHHGDIPDGSCEESSQRIKDPGIILLALVLASLLERHLGSSTNQ